MSPQIYEKYLPRRSASGKRKNYICGEKIPVARALLIGIVILLFSTCYDKGDCLVTNSTFINIAFKKRTNSSLDTSIRFTGIVVIDDTLSFKGDEISSIALPVNPSKTEAGFIFYYPDSVVNDSVTLRFNPDTLKFTYRNETVVPTSDCGAYVYQKNVTIVKTSYDSIRIRKINNQLIRNALNFQILY